MPLYNIRILIALVFTGYAIASLIQGRGAVAMPIAVAILLFLSLIPGTTQAFLGVSASVGSYVGKGAKKAAEKSFEKAGENPWLFLGVACVIAAIAVLAHAMIAWKTDGWQLALLLVVLSAIAFITHADKWDEVANLVAEHKIPLWVAVSLTCFLLSIGFSWGKQGGTFLFLTNWQWFFGIMLVLSLITITKSWGKVRSQAQKFWMWVWEIATFKKGRAKACFLYAALLVAYGYFTNQTRPDDLGKLLATGGIALFVIGVALAEKDKKK